MSVESVVPEESRLDEETERLLIEATNASFDVGAWDSEDATEPLKALVAASATARNRLRWHIRELVEQAGIDAVNKAREMDADV